VKRRGLADEVYPEMYASYMQPTSDNFSVVVRSTAAPATVMAGVVRRCASSIAICRSVSFGS
jgi:hypothetical protein